MREVQETEVIGVIGQSPVPARDFMPQRVSRREDAAADEAVRMVTVANRMNRYDACSTAQRFDALGERATWLWPGGESRLGS